MQEISAQTKVQSIFLYILCYVALIIFAGASLWLILQVRLNILDAFIFFDWDRWVMGAVDKFGIIVFGLGWLIFVMAAEPYLRYGVYNGRLLHRIGRVAVVLVVLLGVSYTLQWLMMG